MLRKFGIVAVCVIVVSCTIAILVSCDIDVLSFQESRNKLEDRTNLLCEVRCSKLSLGELQRSPLFSSHFAAKSSCEQEDDPFSELDLVQEDAAEDESEDESLTDTIRNDMETLGAGKKKYPKSNIVSAMTEAILVSPALTVSEALDKWIEAGNEVTRADILQSMIYLRQRKMFIKALELLKWPESIKHLEYSDSYYASHVDLIARVHGISKAEIYLQQIPECSRNEEVYQALLANCVSALSCRKAEALFDKMKKLFHLTSLSCNLLLLLYKKTDRKKIAGVLLLMEEENIKPSLLTYQILIEVKGQFKDFRGMEQILERMEFEGVEPDTRFQATLARNYADAGLRDKAEAVLKDMEGGDITKKSFSLSVFASRICFSWKG
ncbi:hypothetical protein C2S52_005018 [Perilla frutescens var. hirtella]|nr:hypothetical protein C2S52_005018 [Perilla frutescens var. hirtella]